jgi:hypothetical protein
MSVEQVVDGMIRLFQLNLVARTPLTADALAGTGILTVDDTFRFDDVNEIVLIDSNVDNGTAGPEYHIILEKISSTELRLLHPLGRDFTTASNALIQKSIGHVPIFDNDILFGDRPVIPTERLSITVEGERLTNEWIYLQGGLDEEYALSIMIYLKDDLFEDAARKVMKYSDTIYRLLVENVHFDVVNDVYYATADVSAGSNTIFLSSVDGIEVDDCPRYELQDNNGVEIDYRIIAVDPGTKAVVLNRPIGQDFEVSEHFTFRRRVRYFYDSRAREIEYGLVSKEGGLFRAAKIVWFGKETEDYTFPQQSKVDNR